MRCRRCGFESFGARCGNCRATITDTPARRNKRSGWVNAEPVLTWTVQDGGVEGAGTWSLSINDSEIAVQPVKMEYGDSPLKAAWQVINSAIDRCSSCGWPQGSNYRCESCERYRQSKTERLQEESDSAAYSWALRNGTIAPEPEMTETEKLKEYGPIVASFQSLTTSGVNYDVRYLGGVYSCNCNGWKFRRKCRHMEECARDGITGQKPDPLIKAIEDVFDEVCGLKVSEWVAWKPNKAKVAAAIRSKLNLEEPFSDTVEQPVFRRIILED
jgi:hypothetical protein